MKSQGCSWNSARLDSAFVFCIQNSSSHLQSIPRDCSITLSNALCDKHYRKTCWVIHKELWLLREVKPAMVRMGQREWREEQREVVLVVTEEEGERTRDRKKERKGNKQTETLLEVHRHFAFVELCPALYDPTDCSPPGSSVHGIFQARILEWVAISSSRDWTRVSDPGIESTSPVSPALQADYCLLGKLGVWAMAEVGHWNTFSTPC